MRLAGAELHACSESAPAAGRLPTTEDRPGPQVGAGWSLASRHAEARRYCRVALEITRGCRISRGRWKFSQRGPPHAIPPPWPYAESTFVAPLPLAPRATNGRRRGLMRQPHAKATARADYTAPLLPREAALRSELPRVSRTDGSSTGAGGWSGVDWKSRLAEPQLLRRNSRHACPRHGRRYIPVRVAESQFLESPWQWDHDSFVLTCTFTHQTASVDPCHDLTRARSSVTR